MILYDITANEKVKSTNIYDMIISAPDIGEKAKPGQFLHVKCGELTLRRPVSIASVKGGQVRICYEVRGEGTKWMSELKKGDKIDIMGPLGKGFDMSDLSKKVLLVGGGIGIYPLYWVALAYGANAYAALGFRTEIAVNFEREFRDTGSALKISTDDGSYGKKGFVTELVKEILDNNKIDLIMTCGPRIMMRGVYSEAEKQGIRCQVSMEERMACGIGACLACVCKINGANERVCADGPVFEGSEVDWHE